MCVRLNKLWAEEAVKFLWERFGYGTRSPRIRHLQAFVGKPDRFQWYARYIRSLKFSPVDYEFQPPAYNLRSRREDRAQRHLLLREASLPRLVSIYSQGPLWRAIKYKSSSLLLMNSLQPSLTSLKIYQAVLSDEFFSALKVCHSDQTLYG